MGAGQVSVPTLGTEVTVNNVDLLAPDHKSEADFLFSKDLFIYSFER